MQRCLELTVPNRPKTYPMIAGCIVQCSVFEVPQGIKAQWLSWLERRPVTAEVVGSSPIWVVNGVLAQLGEHLPYKQRVTGSSPVGPIVM